MRLGAVARLRWTLLRCVLRVLCAVCCAVLCCAVLCCAVLCCAVLCFPAQLLFQLRIIIIKQLKRTAANATPPTHHQKNLNARTMRHLHQVMTCIGGCIGGGGQPKSKDPEVLTKRMQVCVACLSVCYVDVRFFLPVCWQVLLCWDCNAKCLRTCQPTSQPQPGQPQPTVRPSTRSMTQHPSARATTTQMYRRCTAGRWGPPIRARRTRCCTPSTAPGPRSSLAG